MFCEFPPVEVKAGMFIDPAERDRPVLAKIFRVSLAVLPVLACLPIVTTPSSAAGHRTKVAAGNNPFALAVSTVTDRIYVANFGDARLTVIDGATNASTDVPVGNRPAAVAVDMLRNKIYVANQGDNTVTEIDGATNNTSTIAVGLC